MRRDYNSCANQTILGRLVSNEFYCNVNTIITDVIRLHQCAQGRPDTCVDEEMVQQLSGAEVSPEDTCDNCGFSFVEYEGDWYWYDRDKVVPFSDDPPTEVLECKKPVVAVRASGFETFYRRRKEAMDDEDLMAIKPKPKILPVGHPMWFSEATQELYETRAEAVKAAWDAEGLEAFYDKEEAAQDCMHQNRLDPEYHDVYEHWAVSPFMARKLTKFGQTVVEYGSMYIWCRCSTGQAVLLDYVIGQIGEDMEILEGMANDWSKKEDA